MMEMSATQQHKVNGDGRCFACARPLKNNNYLVGCKDEQTAFVGADCYRKIEKAGADGYQPLTGGPRLYLMKFRGERGE